MKRLLTLFLALITLFSLSACSFESYVPESNHTMEAFAENYELFCLAADEALGFGFDCLISNTSYYQPDEVSSLSGLYLIDMGQKKAQEISSAHFSSLMNNCGIKMIDAVHCDSIDICCFSFSTPNHDFDYGYYYVSEDKPVYIGDPSVLLTEKGDGYTYEQHASFGSSITFYTEKITQNFYYYEIS